MPSDPDIFLIAIDPGTAKCGIAVFNRKGDPVSQEIIPREKLVDFVSARAGNREDVSVVVGNATQGKSVINELRERLGLAAVEVDEAHSTDEARVLFWKENKAGCFWGIFPPSFRPLPRPVDDYAAVVIGKRYISSGRADLSGD